MWSILDNLGQYTFLIIDTDQDTGNFEREMCAYVTGAVGDCNIGKDEEENFFKFAKEKPILEDYNPDDYVSYLYDTNATYLPVNIWPNPDYWSDGYGNHYLHAISLTSPKVLQKFESAIKSIPYYNEKDVQSTLAQGPRKHPAYMSVAIALEKIPPRDILDLWLHRIGEYCEREGINGYRVKLIEATVNLSKNCLEILVD